MLPLVFLCVTALPLPPNVNAELFPGADGHSATDAEVAGVAALYPGRVLHTPPRINDPANAGRAPKTTDLLTPHEVTYIRIYDLEASINEIAKNLKKPALILDFRYVVADEVASRKLAEALNKAGLDSAPVHGVGAMLEPEPLSAVSATDKDHPKPVVLAIVNRLTAGPLEAWLEAFQEKESVQAVGEPTAGQPAIFRTYDGHPDYFIIQGELRPESGSIVGTGLQPRFSVETTLEQNYLAYSRVERGTVDVANMLRHEHTAVAATASGTSAGILAQQQSAAAAMEAGDPVLQRAVDVVAALQVLGRLPSSKDTGPAKVPATTSATPVQR